MSIDEDTDRPWYEDLDADEYDHMFPGGQADVDAFLRRQAWRAEHQHFPRTCEEPGVLMELATMLLGAAPDDE